MNNWLDTLAGRIKFGLHSHGSRRVDTEADWAWFERVSAYRWNSVKSQIRRVLVALGRRPHAPLTLEWMRASADALWETRSLLVDDLSRKLFDDALVLRMTSHRHFFFPRTEFTDYATIVDKRLFALDDLPNNYLGLPLEIYTLQLEELEPRTTVKLICAKGTVGVLNRYRQYLVSRNGINFSPKKGEIVIDCGSCVGDFTVLFAAMVGNHGEVHAFDPEPLHNRYCVLQAELNPELAGTMRFNALAVGKRTSTAFTRLVESDQIRPGLRVDADSYDCIALDDYAAKTLRRIDFIKMDIEGAELDAIEGAKDVIRTFKPRLAISCYHKPTDLWEIPRKLKSINPDYQLGFGHHSPMQWESVFYAIQPE